MFFVFGFAEWGSSPIYFSEQKNKATTEVITLFWRAGRDSKGYALRARKLADPIMFAFGEMGFESNLLFRTKKIKQPPK